MKQQLSIIKSPSLLLVLLLNLSLGLVAQEIHVSVKGNDHHEGSSIRPLASLEAARDLARRYKLDQSNESTEITVVVHGGYYNLSRSLTFDHRDGGSENRQGNQPWICP